MTTTPTTIAPMVAVEALTEPNFLSTRFERLAVGEVRATQVWAGCDISIEIGDNRYLPDRNIATLAGDEWSASDFPLAWDVAIFNEAPQDGPSWAILDAKVTRIDPGLLEVRHIGTDDVIAMFVLDDLPPEERIACP